MSLQAEQAEHINVVNWFNYQYPDLSDDLHHFANERRCSIQQGRTLKRMGVKRGVSDFFLAIPLDNYSGLWLELKVGKNRLTTEQKAFLDRKTERGYLCVACWGFDAAKASISTYLSNYNKHSSSIELKNLYNIQSNC